MSRSKDAFSPDASTRHPMLPAAERGLRWTAEFDDDYAVPHEVESLVGQGYVSDMSWHNNVCPSFGRYTDDGLNLELFVDHPVQGEREMGDSRFKLLFQADHEDTSGTLLYDGDDMAAALAALGAALRDHGFPTPAVSA